MKTLQTATEHEFSLKQLNTNSWDNGPTRISEGPTTHPGSANWLCWKFQSGDAAAESV